MIGLVSERLKHFGQCVLYLLLLVVKICSCVQTIAEFCKISWTMYLQCLTQSACFRLARHGIHNNKGALDNVVPKIRNKELIQLAQTHCQPLKVRSAIYMPGAVLHSKGNMYTNYKAMKYQDHHV